MKHVQNGKWRKKKSQGRDPKTQEEEELPGMGPSNHDRKSRANSRRTCDLIVRAMEKEESENPQIQYELRRVHDGDRRGFKYVDECLDIQL